jgi:hypothetical protein
MIFAILHFYSFVLFKIIYLLTAIGLLPGGSTHLHINNTQNNTNNNRTTQITKMWKSAGRAPSLRVFTLAFALQLRRKHGKTTVRVRESSVRLIKSSEYSIHITKTPTHYKTDTNTHITKPTHTHTQTHTHTHTHTHYKTV